jgi:hypothetical protein
LLTSVPLTGVIHAAVPLRRPSGILPGT